MKWRLNDLTTAGVYFQITNVHWRASYPRAQDRGSRIAEVESRKSGDSRMTFYSAIVSECCERAGRESECTSSEIVPVIALTSYM